MRHHQDDTVSVIDQVGTFGPRLVGPDDRDIDFVAPGFEQRFDDSNTGHKFMGARRVPIGTLSNEQKAFGFAKRNGDDCQ